MTGGKLMQFYRAVLIDDVGQIIAAAAAFDYFDGESIAEQAHFDGGGVVEAIEILLAQSEPRRCVWAGQFCPEEPPPLGEKLPPVPLNLFDRVRPKHLVRFSFGRADDHLTSPKPQVVARYRVDHQSHPFLLNHSKREIVDKRNSIRDLHPLPILTAEGIDRFRNKIVGRWARDKISVSNSLPNGNDWKMIQVPAGDLCE